MNTSIAKQEHSGALSTEARFDQLADIAGDVLGRCRARGASQVEVGLNEDAGLTANVRIYADGSLVLARDMDYLSQATFYQDLPRRLLHLALRS